MGNTSAIISVIVPAYNAEKTIRECLLSVLGQTFKDFELIVINDGSIDRTLTIIEGILDTRLRVFTFSNSGPQKSRNRGINKARGKYISFIDSDDMWAPDKLECQLSSLHKHPKAAVAYSWTDIVDERGEFVRHGKRSTKEGNVFEELLFDDFIASGSNPLIKAEELRATGGFDEKIVAGQDLDMWLMLAEKNIFCVAPKVHVFYRKSSSYASWSSNLSRQEKGHLQVLEKHLHKSSKGIKSKNEVLAVRYRYLLFECFEKITPTPKSGIIASRYFLKSLYCHPAWWQQRPKVTVISISKIFLSFLKQDLGFLSGKKKT
jgi:GT2 family glycosyltransferase